MDLKKPPRLYKTASIFFCLLFVLTSASFAFDGRRPGFILGAGIGPAFSLYDETDNFGPARGSGSGGNLGWDADLLLGFSTPGESFFAGYSRTAFTSSKPLQNESGYPVGGETPEGIHFLSIGTSIYLSNSSRSSSLPYLKGQVGEMFQFVGTTSNDVYMGSSLAGSVAFGFEFSRHFSFELRYLTGSPEESDRSLSFNSIQVLFYAIAY